MKGVFKSNMNITQNNLPLVSVVIPIYRIEAYMDKCISSVIQQTYQNLEIILVDDGSPDKCPQKCDEYAKKDARIKVIHKENGGLSDARNAGIDVFKGAYITFIDGDDYVTPTYVEYLFSLFDYSDNCNVTACNHFIVRKGNATPNFDAKEVLVLNQREAFDSVLYHEKIDVTACGKLYKREVFKDLRYPKGRIYEDTYLFGSIIEKSSEIVCGPIAQYYYIQRDSSIVHTSFNETKLEFIDSVNVLVQKAETFDPSLHEACVRRKMHSYLSVLRYMDHCEKKDIPTRNQLMQLVKDHSGEVLKNKRTPKRDKIGIVLLKLGFPCFSIGWNLYEHIRRK